MASSATTALPSSQTLGASGCSVRWASVFRRRADGAQTEVPVLETSSSLWEVSASEGENWLVVRKGDQTNEESGRDLLCYRPGADSTVMPLLTDEYDEMSPALSPDV